MKTRSIHKVTKQLARELKHRAWLEKNLKGTELLKRSRRKVLELYTEKNTKCGDSEDARDDSGLVETVVFS
jgi:hypothetical protein